MIICRRAFCGFCLNVILTFGVMCSDNPADKNCMVEIAETKHSEYIDDPESRTYEQDISVFVVSGQDTSVVNALNNRIDSALVRQVQCNPRGDLFVSSQLTFCNQNYLSISYQQMYQCRTMPGPSGKNAGITFSLDNGQALNLRSLVKSDAAYEMLTEEVLNKALSNLDQNQCDLPRFSGEFFLEPGSIVFVEFFPDHYKEMCELEVRMSLRELKPYINSNFIQSMK